MAYMFQPVMMQDGLSRQKKDEEEKKTTAYTPGINEAQKPKQQTPYEERQQRIREGANRTKPVSFAAPTRTQQPEEEEERPQLSYSGGGSSARTQALEAQWFGTQEEEEPEPVTEQPRAVPQRILETESHPDREFYPTTEQPTEKKPAAQRNEPITYTGGQLSQPSTTGTAGSGTKAAMTTEPDQAWLEENGLSWAGTPDQRQRNDQPSSSGPGVNAAQRPTLSEDERWYYDAARDLGESVPESLAYAREQAGRGGTGSTGGAPTNLYQAINITGEDNEIYEDALRIAKDRGRSQAQAEAEARQRVAEAQASAIGAAQRAGYETPAMTQARQSRAQAQQYTDALGAAQRAGYTYEPDRQAYEAAGVSAAVQNDPDFQKYYDNLKAQGQNPQAAAANALAFFESRVQDRVTERTKEIEQRTIERQGKDYTDYTEEQHREMAAQARQQAEREIEAEIGGGRPLVDTEAMGAAQRAGYNYNPPRQPGVNESQRPTSGQGSVASGQNEVSDTAQQVVQRMQDNPGMTLDEALEQIMEETGQGSSSGQGSVASGQSSSSNPKGTVYFNPSYGQGGKGVKLPYKTGGYSEAELQAAGNKAYGVQYGSNVYEGYYKAPDGKYYPVDQEKAAYYKANGNSYNGWEEPMRKYYQTFGTFYGYRPDWQTAGRQTYNYSPRTYSYSGGYRSSSSGANYGTGNTPNNGIYWNGLSRWGI